MREVDGIQILKNMEIAVVKARSIAMETLGIEDPGEESASMGVAIMLQPWLFGKGSVLMPLHKLNDRVRKDGTLAWSDFLNMMWVADRQREIHVTYAQFGSLPDPHDLVTRGGWDTDEQHENAVADKPENQKKDDPGVTPNLIHNLEIPPVHPADSYPREMEVAHKTIFDYPHRIVQVPMIVYNKNEHPINFSIGGTTIYNEDDSEIAFVSPWLDGSMPVIVHSSKNYYLVFVGHVLNEVFKLEGIDIDVMQIKGKSHEPQHYMETTTPRDFAAPEPEYYDPEGERIEIGGRVAARMNLSSSYVYGDDEDRTVIFRNTEGVVLGFDGAKVKVLFSRPLRDDLEAEVYAEHLSVLWEGEGRDEFDE